MVIDCHVHVRAMSPGHGFMSQKLLSSFAFRFMRWWFGLKGTDERTERVLEQILVRTLDETTKLDAAAVLAFDGVYSHEGKFEQDRTHLYVTNDYVVELAQRHPKVLFGASVHPYRQDAVAELERCIALGAVLLKWLPNTQGMDPSDPKCIPFYECLAHHGLPLLCHTGGEQSLPQIDRALGDPKLLEPALKRGVKVIMAHCGTHSAPFETDWVEDFCRLAKQYEHCYGDTSALCLPMRWHAFPKTLNDPQVRSKLVHGSDWPIIPIPPISQVGVVETFDLMFERNWMKRDIAVKESLGFDEAYWNRAADVLRLQK